MKNISKEDVKIFLNEFYEIISFKANERFKEKEFRPLFMPNAVLIEKYKEELIYKSISDHINEFQYAIENNPELFINGFLEKQESFEIIYSENYLVIKSIYSKTMTVNNQPETSYGDNIITLTLIDKTIKIVNIAW